VDRGGLSRALAPIRVLIVDDHALVAEGTRQLLEVEPDLEVVGQAGNAEEGLDLFGRTSPDVALVDINLPGMSGLKLARVAAASHPEVRVLIVSAYDDYAYVTEVLDIGVCGYLLKTVSAKELVDAVRAVADGVVVLDKAVSGRLARRWRGGSTVGGTPRPRDGAGRLSHRPRGGAQRAPPRPSVHALRQPALRARRATAHHHR